MIILDILYYIIVALLGCAIYYFAYRAGYDHGRGEGYLEGYADGIGFGVKKTMEIDNITKDLVIDEKKPPH